MKRSIAPLLLLFAFSACSERNNESNASSQKDSVNVSDSRRNTVGGEKNYLNDSVSKEGVYPKTGNEAQPPGGGNQ